MARTKTVHVGIYSWPLDKYVGLVQTHHTNSEKRSSSPAKICLAILLPPTLPLISPSEAWILMILSLLPFTVFFLLD